MKRSPLQRKTPLRRVAISPRTTPLKRSTARLRLHAPGKPRVTAAERRARKLVRKRSQGWCEIQVPGLCMTLATDWSHRIREGQGGPWSPVNGLHACRPCHSWTHSNPAASRVKGWALKSYDPLDAAVCRRGEWVVLAEDGSFRSGGPLGVAS